MKNLSYPPAVQAVLSLLQTCSSFSWCVMQRFLNFVFVIVITFRLLVCKADIQITMHICEF